MLHFWGIRRPRSASSPLFADINVHTQRHSFSLVVTGNAVFNGMRSKGLIQRDSAVFGDSLREYSALTISSLVDPASHCRIATLSAVEHDSQNRLSYAICDMPISKTSTAMKLRSVKSSKVLAAARLRQSRS
jgi:hypothetical protein